MVGGAVGAAVAGGAVGAGAPTVGEGAAVPLLGAGEPAAPMGAEVGDVASRAAAGLVEPARRGEVPVVASVSSTVSISVVSVGSGDGPAAVGAVSLGGGAEVGSVTAVALALKMVLADLGGAPDAIVVTVVGEACAIVATRPSIAAMLKPAAKIRLPSAGCDRRRPRRARTGAAVPSGCSSIDGSMRSPAALGVLGLIIGWCSTPP